MFWDPICWRRPTVGPEQESPSPTATAIIVRAHRSWPSFERVGEDLLPVGDQQQNLDNGPIRFSRNYTAMSVQCKRSECRKSLSEYLLKEIIGNHARAVPQLQWIPCDRKKRC